VDGACEHGNELSGSINCWEKFSVAAQLASSQKGHRYMGVSYVCVCVCVYIYYIYD
jgi:hypothetical protein